MLKTSLIVLIALYISIAGIQVVASDQSQDEQCNLSQNIIENIANHANVTNKIIDYFISGPFKGKTYNSLSEFVDKFGNRLVGTINLENAIDYIINKTIENNVHNVHTEDVQVPYWARGDEKATLIKPRRKKLPMLGLGYSVATPPKGITAHAIVVRSFEELKALPDSQVVNKIVVYDEPYESYGKTVVYRSKGASEAARKGAVAALVRSIAPFSIGSPHTGMQTYASDVVKIPVAAITLEDADLLWRLQNRGEDIVIRIKMSATLSTKTSRNTIINLEGTEAKDKVVVISGHIDSWDVGDGAMDDGGGAFISWIAPIALTQMNIRPKRTLRTILWTGEELGVIGAAKYSQDHQKENDKFDFVMESDIGTFSPLGLMYSGSKTGECIMREVLKLFSKINATQLILDNDPGPDLTNWVENGIPAGGLYNDNSKYFWYHHSEGDRLNVEDSDTLDRAAAFWTGFSYVVANIDYDIPRK